ncbi:hypothetical protein D3C77_259240 [compost metagenome]
MKAEVEKSADLTNRIAQFQFRNIRPKAASEINDLSDASVLLGHSKQGITDARLPSRRRHCQALQVRTVLGLSSNCFGTSELSSAQRKTPQTLICGAFNNGGRGRNRTGVDGFAIRYRPDILLNQIAEAPVNKGRPLMFMHLHSSPFGTFGVPDLSHVIST